MEVSKACRRILLDFRRCIDKINDTKQRPHNVLGSLLALLGRDKLEVVLEQLLELGDDVVNAREDNHDRILTHLGQEVQIEHDALLSRIRQSDSYNCVHNLGQINSITRTILQGFEQLEGGFSHG